MKKWLLMFAVVLNCVASARCEEPTPTQGSTETEISSLKERGLRLPSQIKVAILPFWDYSSSVEHVRLATSANWLLWSREGFKVSPILQAFDAVAADKKLEPGAALRREDAVRLGKALKVDWVVYGEVKELRPYKKTSFFRSTKNLMAAMRIAVASVKNDEVLYWQSRSEKIGGTGYFGGFQSKASQQKRVGVTTVSMKILAPLFAILPPHPVTGKVPESGDLSTFLNETWPPEKAK